MPSLSVIVCTHNPRRESLTRVLQSLREQSLPARDWELLLIDNASEEPVCEAHDISWHPHGRHLREDTLGLTPARLRGIAESAGDLLVYVDDDNVPAPDYLQAAREIALQHPHLGAVGAGMLEPEYAAAPSPELLPYLSALALRDVRTVRWGNNTRDHDSVPWGAGLCVSRPVARAYEPLLKELGVLHLIDRRGGRLYANGDVAFSWAAVRCGLGFGVFPQLRIKHLIAQDRTTQDYLLRLADDSTFSGCVLDYLWCGARPNDGVGLGERIFRLALRGARKGGFAMRHGWTVAQATARARAFIDEHRLQPIGAAHAAQ